jgi:hypothetical protein
MAKTLTVTAAPSTAPGRPKPPRAFAELVRVLASGEDLDLRLVESIVRGAGRTMSELASAVEALAQARG